MTNAPSDPNTEPLKTISNGFTHSPSKSSSDLSSLSLLDNLDSDIKLVDGDISHGKVKVKKQGHGSKRPRDGSTSHRATSPKVKKAKAEGVTDTKEKGIYCHQSVFILPTAAMHLWLTEDSRLDADSANRLNVRDLSSIDNG